MRGYLIGWLVGWLVGGGLGVGYPVLRITFRFRLPSSLPLFIVGIA